MADKRMFSRKMISSDAFLEMPLTTQGLFFHLCMRADDDGFVDSPKRIMREVGAKPKDLELLIKKRYVLTFPSGVVLIKHWFLHNTIAKDRYTPTIYKEELAAVKLKCGKPYADCGRDDNKSYTERKQSDDVLETDCKQDNRMETECIQFEDKTKHRIDKRREDKSSKEKDNICAAEQHDNDSLESFFESIWQIYPLKKGKGQVSYAKKVKLRNIGYEQIKRCIDRYVAEIKTTGKEKYMQHGSTFFNSGYVDYLDENFSGGKEIAAKENVLDKQRDNGDDEELVGDDW